MVKAVKGIQTTEPLKRLEDVQAIKDYLLKANGYRDYLLACMLLNTGLRASDVLPLKVKDVQTEVITVREKKTGKLRRYSINAKLRRDIDFYIGGLDLEAYLFKSRKGSNRPIDRSTAYTIIQGAVEALGLNIRLGLHGCRKTYAYQLYKKTNDIMLVSHALNHDSPSTTRLYIGLQDEELTEATEDFYL